VPRIFRDCASKGVKGIVLITAGFKEIEDPRGAALQSDLAAFALEAGIPVIGPNTFGMINRKIDLNASFTPEFSLVEEGGVTLVSQSGGISHLLSFVAMREHVGISKIIGLGNRLNLDFAEVMPFLLDDPQTEVIVLYLEGLDDPRQLMSAVAAHRGKKPILALKAGRARSGDRASLSHTGSMAGRHEIYEGALAQSGILCVDDTQELMDLARAFSSCPLPEGPRTAVLTGQAGPGMVACDVCERHGLQMAAFQAPTQETINRWLPPLALRTNPVDMGPAWYDADAIQGIIGAVMEDDHVDGVLLLMMFASANREAVPRISDPLIQWQQKKPLVTCLVSPPGIWDEKVIALERQGALVNLPTPERAAKVMARLWQYRRMI
jgi:acyl-CoA synthetase (NDP forming)